MTINIDPVIFQLGGLEIRWYSLAVLTAVIAAVLIGAREAQKKGIAREEVYSLALWVVLGGVVGARLFHVMENLDYYFDNPSEILHFEGLAIWGALVGGSVAAVVYARVRHLSLPRLFDAAVPALLVAQIIGRLGCIVNGDAYGDVTGLPWGFTYTNPDSMIPARYFGVPTHPYPVYEMLWNATALLILLRLRRYLKVDGTLFLSYLLFYAVGRFALTLVREEKVWFWGLQEAQVIALVVFAASIAALLHIVNRSSRKGQAEAVPERTDQI